jgi:hypothetical protein
MPERPQHRKFASVSVLREQTEFDEWVGRFYGSNGWKIVRTWRLRVDGHRCVYVSPAGRRCLQRAGSRRNPVDVHHLDPLRTLYEAAGSFERFVELATVPDRLRSVCRSHHPAFEREARKREQEEADGS